MSTDPAAAPAASLSGFSETVPGPAAAPPPPVRAPAPPNPRAERQEARWQDHLTADGRRRSAEEAAAAAPRDGETRDDDGTTYKIGSLELTEAQARDLLARDAAEKSHKLTLPATPADYKMNLPPDFQVPQGVEFVPDDTDPRWAMLQNLAHKNGLSQETVSRIVELDAAGKVAEIQAMNNAKAAEVAKLGATGTARKTAVDTFVASVPGVTAEMAKGFSKFMFVAQQVETMEKIMASFRNQGAGTFTNTGREPPANTGAIPGYATMTFEQKRDAQERQRGGR